MWVWSFRSSTHANPYTVSNNYCVDHIAVALFLQDKVCDLTLHFPAKFLVDAEKPQFFDTGIKNWKKNAGRTANLYHATFSEKIKEDSMQQIQSAILIGAHYKEHNGFHERNTHVAKSGYLIALTWSSTDCPKKGGTFDTWTKCKNTKVHVCLESLISAKSDSVTDRKRKQNVIEETSTCKKQKLSS